MINKNENKKEAAILRSENRQDGSFFMRGEIKVYLTSVRYTFKLSSIAKMQYARDSECINYLLTEYW